MLVELVLATVMCLWVVVAVISEFVGDRLSWRPSRAVCVTVELECQDAYDAPTADFRAALLAGDARNAKKAFDMISDEWILAADHTTVRQNVLASAILADASDVVAHICTSARHSATRAAALARHAGATRVADGQTLLTLASGHRGVDLPPPHANLSMYCAPRVPHPAGFHRTALRTVKLLVDTFDVDVDVANARGIYPVTLFALVGDSYVVNYLLDRGAVGHYIDWAPCGSGTTNIYQYLVRCYVPKSIISSIFVSDPLIREGAEGSEYTTAVSKCLSGTTTCSDSPLAYTQRVETY